MNNWKFNKILVANRGEIALRILRAIRKSGLSSVAIFTESDRHLPYVQFADESWPINGATLAETYLNQQLIIDIARGTGATAIHPGYGFMAENADFARLCKKNNIIFIGPSPKVIDLMGNKANALAEAKKHGAPVIEGTTGSPEKILQNAANFQYPVLIKPAAGGGGKGMRIIGKSSELKEAMEDASREAMNYFGSGELYIERYIERARHIEVQVLADHHGNAVHLFERECTLQRRYQKIIEEAPAPSISPETREKITSAALNLTRGINYTNAGTIEFLVDQHENFYFIEMNTRIQVEHPATEMITGIDLVREQICIAGGSKLSVQQEDIKIKGHAIEARLYAEDPANRFMPATGTIRKIITDHVNIRMDNGYVEGNSISPFYDPLISKVISHGADRNEAVRQLISGLKHYHLAGPVTNRDFLVKLLQSDDFASNRIYTKYIDEHLVSLLEQMNSEKDEIETNVLLSMFTVAAIRHTYSSRVPHSIWQETGYWRQLSEIRFRFRETDYRIPIRTSNTGRTIEAIISGEPVQIHLLDQTDNFFKLMIDGKQYQYWAEVDQSDLMLNVEQYSFFAARTDIPFNRQSGTVAVANNSDANEVTAPLNGKVVKINVKANDTVSSGDTLLVIESMKMENRIISPKDAAIAEVLVQNGDLVELNKQLVTFK